MDGSSNTNRRRLLSAGAGVATALLWPDAPAFAQTADEFGSSALKGAGSTFAQPLMAAWAREYRAYRKGGWASRLSGGGLEDDIGGVALDYEAVGSLAGVQRLIARAVDFAVTERPLPSSYQAKEGLVQVPITAGAVAVAANLPALAGSTPRGELRLSAGVLADIFLGRIKTWSDPAIAVLNPGLPLPAVPIVVVHRSDGSGTTYTFTQFLAAGSATWKAQVGSDLLVNWPLGEAARGNAGLARLLERTAGAIGYVNAIEVNPGRLVVAAVQNAAGRFVMPGRAAVDAAVLAGRWDAKNGFETSLVNLDGGLTYPIVATVFALAGRQRSSQRLAMTQDFLDWALGDGRATAERLGYNPLPPAVVQTVRGALRA